MGKASMIPLNYGDRTEHTVVYASFDWKELGYLLSDPTSWTRSLQFHYKQDLCAIGKPTGVVGAECDWTFNQPGTVRIEPLGARDMVLFVKDYGWLASLTPIGAINGPRDTYDDLVKGLSKPNNLKSLLGTRFGIQPPTLPPNLLLLDVTIVSALMAKFEQAAENGMFVVEFALGTDLMYVRYWPPQPHVSSVANFVGSTTDITVSMVNETFGSVHFDMKDSHPRNRACVAIDCIEKLARITQKMSRADSYIFDASLVDDGGLIKPLLRNKKPVKLKFAPDDQVTNPSLTINGLSEPRVATMPRQRVGRNLIQQSIDPTPVCWFASVRVDGNVYKISNINAKLY